jgi:hypothetical protein
MDDFGGDDILFKKINFFLEISILSTVVPVPWGPVWGAMG